jgi:hypothetical protein
MARGFLGGGQRRTREPHAEQPTQPQALALPAGSAAEGFHCATVTALAFKQPT